MNKNNSSGFTRFALIISLLAAIFVVVSIVGVMMDSSVRKSEPKLSATKAKTLPSSSETSNTSTAQLNSEVEASLSSIQNMLEAYFANDNYYPGDLSSPAQIINQSGTTTTDSDGNATDNSQSLESTFTPPAGVKYVYTPTPAGCTTASKNCQHYTLKAVQTSNGAVLDSKTSLN